MLKNYLKIAWRNLAKNKLHSFINITGLATGMAVALLAAFWIWDEITFDRYFTNYKKLAQVMVYQEAQGENYTGESIAMPLGHALRSKYGQDFKYVALTSWQDDYLVSHDDKKFFRGGIWAQSDFPQMLTLNMVAGSRDGGKDPSSAIISQSLANALFDKGDALNKTVRVNNNLDLKVAGVYKDFPRNTSFYDLQIILPWENQENWLRNNTTNWENHSGQLFVQLQDGVDLEKTSAKIRKLPTGEIKKWYEDALLHPFTKRHLYSTFKNRVPVGGAIDFVFLFGTIGVFVLLLACINFMNLSTARSEKRAKEVGIRKTVGSLRGQLIGQFLSESLLMAFMSFALSILLVQFLLPFFNKLADKQIPTLWNQPVFWGCALLFTMFTGLLAGSYPAFYLSGFKPIKVLKGALQQGRFASLPRKVLVVVQFTVSVTLIICTMVVYKQIQYAKDRPVGYQRNGLLSVSMVTPELAQKYEAIRTELLQTGVVENVSKSSHSTIYFNRNNEVYWKGKDPANVRFFRDVTVSADFGRTIGWTIKEGRDFIPGAPADSNSVVVNEEAVKVMGFKNPLGEVLEYDHQQLTIIGVTRDMITYSPYTDMQPSIFFLRGWTGTMTIRIKAGAPVHSALAKIEPVFKKFNPGSPFDYSFIDEQYSKKFASEQRTGSLATFFASLAIFISCLGLFGLASYVAEQRTKEIGVRKVLGASIVNLWHLLSKDFVGLVLISLLIAIPLAWYFMHGWLQDYTYRTTMSWWIFVAAGVGAIVITLLTVSVQSIKAALMNPVKSLRTE